MAAPYGTQALSGYNANPPADDGSQVAANKLAWSKHKEKIGDPLKNQIAAVDTELLAAFAKVIGGGGLTDTALNYTVLAADQGKLVRATAAVTITTPDATVVTSPFIFGVLNNSSGSVTIDGSGSQTVNGAANMVLAAGSGVLMWTDGSNWYAIGGSGVLVGAQMGYDSIINGTLAESNGSNAVTFALKTLSGGDPSATDPVLLAFRNATAGTGNYVYRTVTSALSITIPNTATMGAINGQAFRLWIVLFDDGGTIRIGAINCRSSTTLYPLGRHPLATSTAVGTGSDSAQVFYTNGAGVTSKPYLILAYANYESGLATAGVWNVSPGVIQLFGPSVPLPGSVLQTVFNTINAVQTTTTAIPADDTIPQNTEGTEYLTQAITPTSAANILRINSRTHMGCSQAAALCVALFQDSTAGALSASYLLLSAAGLGGSCDNYYDMVAATTSATTFKLRMGPSGGTLTLNGQSGARLYGGVQYTWMTIEELMG